MVFFNIHVEQSLRHGRTPTLKETYHPLYSINKFVTNKSKLPQDGAQVFPYISIWGDWLSCDPRRGSHDSQSPHIRT